MFSLWHSLPRGFKHGIARSWYEIVSRLDRTGEILFLNHGYAPLGGEDGALALDPADEVNRYPIQLYRHVASGVDWSGRDVLEVASGRGGGAAYLMRALKPRSFLGIDLTKGAIDFCRRHYRLDGLSFRQGDALRLPLADESVDIVLNVESSNNFPGKAAFFKEVARVLRPGGHFLFADYRRANGVDRLRRQLREAGLACVEERDISRNILRALELDDERKRRLIASRIPRPLQSVVRKFAFVRSGEDDEHAIFARGEKVYLSFVLRKPPSPDR